MPAIKKKNDINLIPQDKFAASTFGKILNWLLSTFRVIVIFVEMVVMIAFLSRFWLDAKNSDLNDEMKSKSALLTAAKDSETRFKETQDKIAIVSTLIKTSKTSDTLSLIPTVLPEGLSLKSINVTGPEIRVDGEAPSEDLIAQFIANLEASPKYSSVNLGQIGTDQERGTITFRVVVKVK